MLFDYFDEKPKTAQFLGVERQRQLEGKKVKKKCKVGGDCCSQCRQGKKKAAGNKQYIKKKSKY